MQAEMFDAVPRARRTDPLTSHLAAASATKFAGTHQMQIHALLITYGPMTADEIAAHLRMTGHQCNKRLPELQRLGIARPTGHTRPGISGRMQRVWEAV